ncbi:MAG: dTDP-4-dehydrorhamnose reductase [Rhodospirillaceae bacterium]
MKKILITGASGQLGHALTQHTNDPNIFVLGYDRASLDVTNKEAVNRIVLSAKPDVVINAAAYTAVDKAENDAETAFSVNRNGPLNLASACVQLGVPLIHVSTDYVFDGAKRTPYSETDSTSPLGVYGTSKLAGEDAIREICNHHIILRTAWLYGVHGKNFVKTMLRLSESEDTLRVVNDQHGSPTFANDLATGIFEIVAQLTNENVPTHGFGTFHSANAGQTTWHEFANRIIELAAPITGKKPTVNGIATSEYPVPARRPANSILNCSKLSETYGVTLRPWDQALADMLSKTLVG